MRYWWEDSETPGISASISSNTVKVLRSYSVEDRSREYRSNPSPPRLPLLTSCSWSAVYRGAVIYGMTKKNFSSPLKVAIKSRIARESCGVICEEPWNDELHNPECKKFDIILRKDMAIRVMKWHAVKVSSTTLCIMNARFLTALIPDDRATKSQKRSQ